MSGPYWLDEEVWFPHPNEAATDPDGLLAIGGDLRPDRLILAYQHGIFPWYSDDQPVLWWSPDPRCVIFPDKIHISKSMRRTLNRDSWRITMDTAFEKVIRNCHDKHEHDGVWLLPEMINAYINLHEIGLAHSMEIWHEDELIGGIYGVAMGKAFFAESMFSSQSNSSKLAMIYLAKQLEKWGFLIIDCQVFNPHLESMGATMIPRSQFLAIISSAMENIEPARKWVLDWHWKTTSACHD